MVKGLCFHSNLDFGFNSPDKSYADSLPRCCLENKAVLFFSNSGTQSFSTLHLPLIQFTSIDCLSYTEIEAEGTTWKVMALKTENVGTLLAEFSKNLTSKKFLPFISIILDDAGSEYLLLVGKEGQMSLSSMRFLIDHFLVEFKGKTGIEIKIPQEWGSNDDHSLFYLGVN